MADIGRAIETLEVPPPQYDQRYFSTVVGKLNRMLRRLNNSQGIAGPPGPPGPAGQQGPQGPQGPSGTGTTILGTQFFGGHGPPLADVGNNGDWYLDLDTVTLWGPKYYLWTSSPRTQIGGGSSVVQQPDSDSSPQQGNFWAAIDELSNLVAARLCQGRPEPDENAPILTVAPQVTRDEFEELRANTEFANCPSPLSVLVRRNSWSEPQSMAGVNLPSITVTFGYAVTDYDFMIRVDTTAGDRTIILPSDPDDGRLLCVAKISPDSNTVTVDGNGKLINAASTLTMSSQFQSTILHYSATEASWLVIAIS